MYIEELDSEWTKSITLKDLERTYNRLRIGNVVSMTNLTELLTHQKYLNIYK